MATAGPQWENSVEVFQGYFEPCSESELKAKPRRLFRDWWIVRWPIFAAFVLLNLSESLARGGNGFFRNVVIVTMWLGACELYHEYRMRRD